MCDKFDQDRLIEVVREQRLLWDKRHKNYRNRALTKRAWRNVAEMVGCTTDEVQTKWKNLRDSFSRELKKIPRKRAGGPVDLADYPGDWLHFEAMQFLKGVIRHRKSAAVAARIKKTEEKDHLDEESVMSNSTGMSSTADNHTYLQSEFDTFASIQYGSNEVPTESLVCPDILLQKDYTNSDVTTTVETKVKPSDFSEMYADIERQKLDLLKKEIEFQEDEDMNWFKSILPHMRTLPSFNKFLFRTKVQEMLLNELSKFNSSQPGSSSNQNSSSTASTNTSKQ